ncbi:hypothetical protein AVEN_54638-1 [Araneus ventricosus]|uniref:Tc1-like transposase DDE domain-containing protein n=1 Tax=Araneus ventricosus TaxID=182803 RepID=A0A4Y2BLA7_ARAVE|nr:hypothetical protein AVEN_54638-1 [Araneus ventricosus]
MQDGAPPHIGLCVQQFLLQHFTNDRVISRAFPSTWPSRSPVLNPCDFWLWENLKSLVYRGRLVTLADLKESITLHAKASQSTNYDPQLNKLSTNFRFYILKKGTILSSFPCINKVLVI